jgi:enoyl-CoA hydratase
MAYHHILAETDERVGLITLNRPEARNALSLSLMHELRDALAMFEADDDIGAMVITGGPRQFSTGADIREMSQRTYAQLYLTDFPDTPAALWRQLAQCRKPLVAAVAGPALGGGCELALLCDFILAAESARFGQPEVKLGTMPGAGGTQRLARCVGKAKAMEMCLTGRLVDAHEAERIGLASRVVADEALMAEARAVARMISTLSMPAVMAIKESINMAFEAPLAAGLHFERRAFQATFATAGPAEGIEAFLARRAPRFVDERTERQAAAG